jgi:hypothetical protein
MCIHSIEKSDADAGLGHLLNLRGRSSGALRQRWYCPFTREIALFRVAVAPGHHDFPQDDRSFAIGAPPWR